MIDVLFARNAKQLQPEAWDALLSYLPKEVSVRASQFRRWQDAQAHVYGRILLAEALVKAGFSFKLLNDVRYNPYGRPYINEDFDFNISHSGSYVICVVSFGKDIKVGIDIEKVRPMEMCDEGEMFRIARMLSMDVTEADGNKFFKWWAIHEALKKADGRGFSLSSVPCMTGNLAHLDDRFWYIENIPLDGAYECWLAANVSLSPQCWTLREWDFKTWVENSFNSAPLKNKHQNLVSCIKYFAGSYIRGRKHPHKRSLN